MAAPPFAPAPRSSQKLVVGNTGAWQPLTRQSPLAMPCVSVERVKSSPRTCASGAVAAFLGVPVSQGEAAAINGSLVMPSGDFEPETGQSESLVAMLLAGRGTEAASGSQTAAALLRWALARLRVLSLRLPRNEVEEAATVLQADETVVSLSLQEAELLDQALRIQHAAEAARVRQTSEASAVLANQCVRFARGGALLSSLAVRAAAPVLELLERQPSLQVILEGHASLGESTELALRRAQVVLRHLASKGVATDRLTAVAAPAHKTAVAPCVTFEEWELLSEVLTFAPCSDALNNEAQEAVTWIAAELLEAPFVHVRVDGHCDSQPMWLGNEALADGRADRVARLLEKGSVSRARLRAMRRSIQGTDASPKAALRLAFLVAGAGPQVGASLRRSAAGLLESWGATWAPSLVPQLQLRPETAASRPGTAGGSSPAPMF